MANAINLFKNQTNPSTNKKNTQDLNLSDEDSAEAEMDSNKKEEPQKKTKSKIVIQKKNASKKVSSACNDNNPIIIESTSGEETSKPTTLRTLRKRKSNDTLCKRLSSPEPEIDDDQNGSKNKIKK